MRRHKGRIARWNQKRQYAIIDDNAGGTCLVPTEVLHGRTFAVGDVVTFWQELGPGGKPRATKVTVFARETQAGGASGRRGGGARKGKEKGPRAQPYGGAKWKGKEKGPHTTRPLGGTRDDVTQDAGGGGGGGGCGGGQTMDKAHHADAAGARAVMDAMRLRHG
eukprot:gene7785-15817_t